MFLKFQKLLYIPPPGRDVSEERKATCLQKSRITVKIQNVMHLLLQRSEVEPLPRMYKALGSSPNIAKNI